MSVRPLQEPAGSSSRGPTAFDPPDVNALRTRVVSGFVWKAASQSALQVTRIIGAIVLARLLTPDDYGLAAMALAVASFGLVFSDVALGAVLVQRRSLSALDCSTVFWASSAAGLFCTGLGIGLAAPVARFFGEPAVGPLVATLSVTFVLTAVGTTQTALLERSHELSLPRDSTDRRHGLWNHRRDRGGRPRLRRMGDHRAAGRRVRSHDWASLVRVPLATEIGVFSSIAAWSRRLLCECLRIRLIFYVNRSADNLLIGRFLGAAPLGAYAVAYNIMLLPLARIAFPLRAVFLPAFARLQDDRPKLADAWVRGSRAIWAISAPLYVGLAVLAPQLVSVVLGSKWAAAIPVIQVLAWVGLLQSAGAFHAEALQAINRTDMLFRFSIGSLVVIVSAFVIGLHWGIVGVAASYAIASTIAQPFFMWLTASAIGTSPFAFARGLFGVGQATLCFFVVLIAAKAGFTFVGVPDALLLVILAVVGSAVYLGACSWRAPGVVADIRLAARSRRGLP